MNDEKPIPTWQKLTALTVMLSVAAVIVIFRGRLGADFWPLDSSRVAPNILAGIITWAAVLIAGVLIWPPTRRRLHRFVDHKIAPLHAKLDAHEAMHQQHADKLDHLTERIEALHAKHDGQA